MIEILIPDPEDFDGMVAWAKTLESFISVELIDVTDVDYSVDNYGIFQFGKSSDAVMFKLRWKIQ